MNQKLPHLHITPEWLREQAPHYDERAQRESDQMAKLRLLQIAETFRREAEASEQEASPNDPARTD